MAISESKKKIVIDNYFKKECDVNTSIKEAFTKGFELGLKKAPTPQPKTGHWIKVTNGRGGHECDLCHEYAPSYQSGDENLTNYCPNCGARMVEPQESEE